MEVARGYKINAGGSMASVQAGYVAENLRGCLIELLDL